MKVVIVYQRKKRAAENPAVRPAFCGILKFLLCVLGAMAGFFLSALLWADGFGLDPVRIIADSSWLLLFAASAYALLYLSFSSASSPRRAKPALADFAGIMGFLLSFGFGMAGIRAALWVAA